MTNRWVHDIRKHTVRLCTSNEIYEQHDLPIVGDDVSNQSPTITKLSI